MPSSVTASPLCVSRSDWQTKNKANRCCDFRGGSPQFSACCARFGECPNCERSERGTAQKQNRIVRQFHHPNSDGLILVYLILPALCSIDREHLILHHFAGCRPAPSCRRNQGTCRKGGCRPGETQSGNCKGRTCKCCVPG